MAKRKWESVTGHHAGLSETEAVSEEEDGINADPARSLDLYLKFAEECMETLENMPLRNFNNVQCDYLVDRLKVVIQSASLFVETEAHRPGSFVDAARHIETFKLLLALANQIESFVKGCCQDAWIQAAMTWTNVAEHVSSIVSNLELCKVAFFQQCAATESLSLDQIVDIINAEVEIVKKKASIDVETLLARVTLELNSLKSKERDLASFLLQRLLRVQASHPSFTSASSLLGVNDDESFWARLFHWVHPAERLGKGSAATVHKATWLGMQVAKKTFQGHENPDFMQEVGILGKLCHPNITSMFCCAKHKRWCAIIMELMDEDLHDLMQRRCNENNCSYPFSILEALDIMLQIGEGVNYLHSQKIVHRDLKSFNILVKTVKARGVEIEYVHAKVADFGLSKTKESSIRYSNQTFNTGTNRWMAPEIINLNVGAQARALGPKYPFKCDVYSFAMVCYEILTGYEPFFEEMSLSNIKEKVLKGVRPSLPDYCPLLLKALIEQCWIQEPKDRPSFAFICSRLKYFKYLLMTATLLKRPRTPPSTTPTLDYQSADSEHLMKRARPGVQPVDDVKTVNYAGGPSHPQNNASPDDLPKNVARSFNQGSCVMSMDFHPIQQTVLLVGTNVGDIGIWEVGSREKLAQRTFKVWDITVASMPMQAALVKDPAVSVNRTVWSPDGTLLGVAFSKHIVHIYAYNGASDLRQHLEIDAHVGGVNDLAFSHPNQQLCVITCGDDKTIKVWDAATGRKQYTYEGHEAPVYSVCPHHKESIQFIFSTAIDGKIKAWLYDLLGSIVDYDAPGHWCTTMAYSADGTRLFSCGTSKDGESYLVEWNESEGAIKRAYSGFRKRSSGVVQFDTTRNRFLAAGDEFQIKFWDMDNTNLLTTIDAEGGLPASPRLRFNKEGTLLAVTASDNGIKILANRDGMQMLRGLEARAYDANRVPAEPAVSKPPVGNALGVVSTPGGGGGDRPNSSSMAGTGMDGPTLNMGGSRVRPRDRVGNDHSGMDGGRTPETKPRIPDEIPDRSKSWKLAEINEQSQCRSTRLPDTLPLNKVARLIYTNAGVALLALASNALHKLWKWQRNERNPSGKATASVAPALWQPASGILMINDISETSPEEAVPCIALSKNDSYLMSASGGKVSLFNMMTFKVMTTFMPPPPAATFLAFHPQDNNIIAIGMEDSTIQIYNVRVDEVKSKLKGHQKRITGLAFSNTLNVLVSSGADAQLCMWGTDGWEKRKSKFVQVQPGARSPSMGDTRVQFHNDQVRLLVVHESQLAVYDASKLDRIRQWVPQSPFTAAISNATYSCDSALVYTGFVDGSVGVFDAESLRPRCRLAPSVHIPQGVSGSTVYPLVIAAHPAESNQFALGLSDGGVQVIEPLESEGKWGTCPPADNGTAIGVPSGPASGNQGSDQTPR